MNTMLSYQDVQELTAIVEHFDIERRGEIDLIKPFGTGRINNTYMITCRDGERRNEYLLQSINTFVFADPERLMQNLVAVTEHIRTNGGHSLEFISTISHNGSDKSYVYTGQDGRVWRMYNYVEADVYPFITRPHHAYMLGEAIADFSKSLQTFDASTLVETIPDFHNTPKRLNDFLLVIVKDVIYGGLRTASDEVKRQISFVISKQDKLGVLMDNLRAGTIPIRVTHNDPKIDNVLFDKKRNTPICMIDLDTIMPGTGLFDVGDALRSIGNTASEDEKNESKVDFSLTIFENFVRGYLKGMNGLLTDKEIELIPYSVWVIAMELGIRFLADHIDNNRYFKTQYDWQNLERSRIQFKLAEVVEEKIESGVLSGIVQRIVDEMQRSKNVT